MDMILVKIFATALALSEVTTQPQAVKTHFDPVQDRAQVVQILRDGCAHMRQAFDIESINLDDLISTALNDPKAVGGDIKAFHGINFSDLNTAYHQFCKNESVANPVVDLGQVIEFFNNAAADLPDQTRLKGHKLPSMSVVLDGKGGNFANVFEPRNRRVWIPLATIPDLVQKAFVAAEDRRFFDHHGVDERGIIRAFIGNFANPGRPQGGSTITQQVVKNLLVGDDVTYERKIREMIVASRVESTLGKPEILELYLNSAYLGRGSWGVEMAARSYFGKSAKNLTLAEGAMLAGLLKGPSFFNPDRHPERAKERLAYVLGRMQDDGVISAEDKDHALAAPPKLVAFEQKRRDSGLHFIDFLGREAKSDGVASLTAEPYIVHSTINATLQREAEAALQEGLARYETSAGRTQFRGPEANIGDAIQKLLLSKQSGAAGAPGALPAWQQALQELRLPLSDVHWEPAVILDKGGKRGDGVMRVGLKDGRVLPLNAANWQAKRNLGLHDVVYVHVTETRTVAKPRTAPGAEDSRCRPRRRRRPCGIARAADRARRGLGAGEQDRPHSGDGRQLFVWLEPAQSHLADAAPARFGDEAAHLFDGAAIGTAAQHAGARRSDHARPGRLRWRRQQHDRPRTRRRHARGIFLVAAQCRRRHRRPVHDAARAGEFGQRRDRSPARRRHQRRPGKKPRRSLRHGRRGENLQRLRPLLSVRAWRAAGAHDRSRRLLRRGRQ